MMRADEHMFYFETKGSGLQVNDYISWGQEYLDEAERIKRRLLVIRAERDYDIAGEQAQRVQMLYTMYLECLVTGHALQKRGRRAVS